MKNKALAVICIFALLYSSAGAQTQLTDTLRMCIKRKASPDFSLDSRDSFIANRHARTYGVRIGVDFGGRLKMGGGYYQLGDELIKFELLPTSAGSKSIKSNLFLGYLCYYVEYVFYNTKRWKFSTTPQVGIGLTSYNYFYGDLPLKTDRHPAFIYEPCLSGEYKLTKWLGVGASAGFRLMLKNRNSVKENFNAPIYSFSVLIHWDKLYKILFPNTTLAKKI